MARRGAGANGCLMNRIWGNSRWQLGTRAPRRPVRMLRVPAVMAHVAIDVSADKDLRIKVAWNPSQSRTPRVIPRFRRLRSPRFTSRTIVTIPPFCFVAVNIWRGRQLRGGYRMRTWTVDGGSKSGPVQQATVRGAAKMGRRRRIALPVTADACLLMIDYRVEACAAALGVNQQYPECRRRGQRLVAQGLHAQRAAWP